MAKILLTQNYRGELNGMASIASYISQKHQVGLGLGSFRDILKKYVSFKPDVVGIHAKTMDHHWALGLAAEIKSIDRDCIILLGGPHPTYYPEILADKHIDAICIGEGEKPVLNLLNRIDGAEEYYDIPSLWVKKDSSTYKNKTELLLRQDEICIPDVLLYKDFPSILKSGVYVVMCSRGCPFNCYFCSEYESKLLFGANNLRIRKVEDIIREIELAREKRPVKIIKFQDDIFGLDKAWLRVFLKQYNEKIKLPFYCLLRCEYTTEDMIDRLKDAGCFRIGIGVESGDDYVRNKVLNKNLSLLSIENAAEILRSRGIPFHFFNMFGLPHQDYASALKTLELNIRLKPDPAYSTIFQPYPGTKFFSDKVKNSILSPSFSPHKINYSYSPDSKKIFRLQKFFLLIVKFPWLRHFLPLLVRLPLDRIYDRLSKFAWGLFFYGKVKKGL